MVALFVILRMPFCSNTNSFGNKSSHIKSIQENIRLLKHLNVRLVNFSNNHIFD